jgi:hypothetical protein
VIITTQHLYTVPSWGQKKGLCAVEARKWFSAHGLSWSSFVFNGIESDILLATGDALAARVVEHALTLEQQNG